MIEFNDKLVKYFSKKRIKRINGLSSVLFFDYKYVYKIFDDKLPNFNQQINTILTLDSINEDCLVKPVDYIYYDNRIIGFTMPYIKGCLLRDYIYISFNIIIKLYELIFYLDKQGINIGDLHEENIIIDRKENIKIIDTDTLIIKNVEFISNTEYNGKYLSIALNHGYCRNREYSFNLDLFCLFSILLNIIAMHNNIEIADIYENYYYTDDNIIKSLLSEKNLSLFFIDKNILLYIINNINFIKFIRNEKIISNNSSKVSELLLKINGGKYV